MSTDRWTKKRMYPTHTCKSGLYWHLQFVKWHPLFIQHMSISIIILLLMSCFHCHECREQCDTNKGKHFFRSHYPRILLLSFHVILHSSTILWQTNSLNKEHRRIQNNMTRTWEEWTRMREESQVNVTEQLVFSIRISLFSTSVIVETGHGRNVCVLCSSIIWLLHLLCRKCY